MLSGGAQPTSELTIVELLAAFKRHAKAYYVDGHRIAGDVQRARRPASSCLGGTFARFLPCQ
jgi:hypothetical protein